MAEATNASQMIQKEQNQPTKQKHWKKSLLGLGLTVLVLITVLGIVGYYQANKLMAPMSDNLVAPKTVYIPPQSSTTSIANLLSEEDLIRSPLLFKLYARYHNLDTKLQAGEYEFSASQPLPKIVEKITEGQVTTYSFTIPEGYMVDQTAELLAEKGLVDKNKFLYLINQGDFDYDFVRDLPQSRFRLEGFLFPDTYQIPKGFGEKEIINLMLRRFKEVFVEKNKDQLAALDLDIKDVVTMASIIEREARIKEEQTVIASVFYNRLKKGMPLQSCATVQYALGEQKEVLLYEDLEIDSPFNTYKNSGLPPAPIAAPGKSALEAALNPAATDYLYFVAKPDGSHEFNTTLQAHNRDKRKYIY